MSVSIGIMEKQPYHHYLFFEVRNKFYQLPKKELDEVKHKFAQWLESLNQVTIIAYATQGFKADSTFVLWCRSDRPEAVQDFLRELRRTKLGQWLRLRKTMFGITRASQYSRQPQAPEQIIKGDDRLPYLIIYPFTKTIDWYLLSFETRAALMKAHIKVGIEHPQIRQCLLYSYGVDDQEFIVSYETPSLEEFQDLVIALRSTEVRRYTANDQPTYTCIYKPIKELMEWL